MNSKPSPKYQQWQIPNHTKFEISERQSKYCVCIFGINTGENIRNQLQNMQAIAQDIDIIIADSSSTDSSLEIDFLKSVSVRTLLIKQNKGKLSAQMRMAFAYAMLQNYEGIITIDGNNQDDPTAIYAFIQGLEQGCDRIQGSRFIKGGKAINTPWHRYLAMRLIHTPLISLSAGFRYTDTTNGFCAYSRRLLLDPRVAPFRNVFNAYELPDYLAIRAVELGYLIKELPVTRRYPNKEPIFTKISPIKNNVLILQALFKACFHKFNPPDIE